ncbi:MAG: release factor glutamine methyltransferase, partial [Nocardioidaceae bacterium]|nr:release factor glutamine methyltransferase [Nocardioidaceae bacterium]
IDPVAAACAALNLPRSAPTYCGDLFEPLPERFTGRIDVLVANAPYVPSDALDLMPREARLYEPVEALDGGADGLDVHRRLLAGAGDWQPAAGHLLVEVAEEQVPTAVALFQAHGYRPAVVRDPEIGGTVIVGRRTVEPGVSVR